MRFRPGGIACPLSKSSAEKLTAKSNASAIWRRTRSDPRRVSRQLNPSGECPRSWRGSPRISKLKLNPKRIHADRLNCLRFTQSLHGHLYLAAFVVLGLAGCAQRRAASAGVPSPPAAPNSHAAPAEPAIAPGTYLERGVASWYGPPFHGRQSSSGEVFDMNQFVAAHRTLPFGSIVRVTNLNNGKNTEVRIIDRGPFVEGRVIDLSLAAARAIDMVGTGVAPVRLELVSSPVPLTGAFSVQVGAFQQRKNADRLQADLSRRYPVFVQDYQAPSGRLYRVRVGRLATQQAAERLAAELTRERGFHNTFVVRLDGLQ
jgi:rare lipoprotein A